MAAIIRPNTSVLLKPSVCIPFLSNFFFLPITGRRTIRKIRIRRRKQNRFTCQQATKDGSEVEQKDIKGLVKFQCQHYTGVKKDATQHRDLHNASAASTV